MDVSEIRSHDFFRKLVRGKQHIENLKTLITAYQGTHPYEVRQSVAGKKKVWRLHITAQPPVETALVIGDALYNTRASLDYLMGELCTRRSDAGSAYFPIASIQERIWEIPEVEGEDEERSRQRKNWSFFERALPPDVLAMLKTLEVPKKVPPKGQPINELLILNTFANKDRHTRLHVVATGLDASTVFAKAGFADGTTQTFAPGEGDRILYEDGAVFPMMPGVVQVEARGTVKVVIPIGGNSNYVAIPDALDEVIKRVTTVEAHLAEHLR